MSIKSFICIQRTAVLKNIMFPLFLLHEYVRYLKYVKYVDVQQKFGLKPFQNF